MLYYYAAEIRVGDIMEIRISSEIFMNCWRGIMENNEEVLYVCNSCHEMHEDVTACCEICGHCSMRVVQREELIN